MSAQTFHMHRNNVALLILLIVGNIFKHWLNSMRKRIEAKQTPECVLHGFHGIASFLSSYRINNLLWNNFEIKTGFKRRWEWKIIISPRNLEPPIIPPPRASLTYSLIQFIIVKVHQCISHRAQRHQTSPLYPRTPNLRLAYTPRVVGPRHRPGGYIHALQLTIHKRNRD